MKKMRVGIAGALVGLALAAACMIAFPATALAAQTIDVSTLSATTTFGGTPGADSWIYMSGNRILYLYDAGPYTLTGTNGELSVLIQPSAYNAQLTLDNVNINYSPSFGLGLGIFANSTITLLGSNNITVSGIGSYAFSLNPGFSCTIQGDGTLTMVSQNDHGLDVQGTLSIIESVALTVTGDGSVGAIHNAGSILMGDNASLTINNNSGSQQYLTVDMAPAPDATTAYQWKLDGDATLGSGALTDSSITILIVNGGMGIISRELIPVAPTITSANNFSCVTGSGGSLALTATGDAPITWSLDGSEPAGVTITGSTLNVAATVPAGTYIFGIIATNGIEPDATQEFTLTVTAAETVNPDIPPTGDSAGGLLLAAALLTMLGCSLALAKLRRRRNLE